MNNPKAKRGWDQNISIWKRGKKQVIRLSVVTQNVEQYRTELERMVRGVTSLEDATGAIKMCTEREEETDEKVKKRWTVYIDLTRLQSSLQGITSTGGRKCGGMEAINE